MREAGEGGILQAKLTCAKKKKGGLGEIYFPASIPFAAHL